jgi:hypothetical protein
MRTVVVRYRRRGTADSWREVKLSVEPGETVVDRINRFEDENYGAVEVLPAGPSVRLIHSRKS